MSGTFFSPWHDFLAVWPKKEGKISKRKKSPFCSWLTNHSDGATTQPFIERKPTFIILHDKIIWLSFYLFPGHLFLPWCHLISSLIVWIFKSSVIMRPTPLIFLLSVSKICNIPIFTQSNCLFLSNLFFMFLNMYKVRFLEYKGVFWSCFFKNIFYF